MDEYSRHVKTYLFADNAVWFEVTCTQKTFVTKVEYEVAGIKMVKEVTDVLCETEYFNTDNGVSKFLYEK